MYLSDCFKVAIPFTLETNKELKNIEKKISNLPFRINNKVLEGSFSTIIGASSALSAILDKLKEFKTLTIKEYTISNVVKENSNDIL